MRDYGKVHTSFWSSPTISALSDDAKILALYLLTCSHGTIAGVFRLPDGYAAEDLEWSPARVREGFVELFRNGFANRCETTKWVFLHKHFDWNPPDNPNQRKAAAKIASQIPDECAWKPEFMRVWGEFLDLKWVPPEEPLPNGSETLSKPVAVAVAVAVAEPVAVTVTENPPPPRASIRPIGNWTPKPETIEALTSTVYGVPGKFVDEQLIEFRAYWRDDGKSATSWDSKFLQRCAGEWKAKGHLWVESPQAVDESGRPAWINDFAEEMARELESKGSR